MRVIKDSNREDNRETIDDDISSAFKSLTDQELSVFLTKLKEINKSKRTLYEIYDKMAHDSLIAGAMKIISMM